MDNIAQEKRLLRQKFLTERTKQPSAHANSEAAQQKLLTEIVWQHACSVALYMAVRGEMSTNLLLEHAWRTGKCVLLPRCRPEQGKMDFVPCTSMDDLAPGNFGIMEPHAHLPAIHLDSDAPHIMVIPGTAFDKRGNRLGFGGGYYDRLFAEPWCCPHTIRMGLCYSWQIVEALPIEAWDMPMNALITEEGLLWI